MTEIEIVGRRREVRELNDQDTRNNNLSQRLIITNNQNPITKQDLTKLNIWVEAE